MSTTNINNEFVEFGKRMKAIAILTLLNLIFGIVGLISPILGLIITVVFFIPIIILFLLVLGNTNRAGKELNNKELLDFKPKFLWGTIIRFIGQIFWAFGWAIPAALFIIIGFILILIGSIFRYQAWNGLAIFFDANKQIFTDRIAGNANTGSKLCKIACILDITVILSSIGEILRIVGYFMLAKIQYIGQAPAQPVYQTTTPQPARPPAVSTSSARFCPNCGSSISGSEKFCGACGSEL